ncbi:MAG: LysR family transcriptional regulator [Synergistaceae bacterium]|nr:LysR family transcriptional regulator [Synergistaceae bacterium]
MRMSHIRYFVEVAHTKSMTAAAKNLHLSQPSLSYAVKAIEDEIGIPLLHRHSNTISLTDAGEKFLSEAERIIESADNLTITMKGYAGLKAGNLRLGMLWIAGYMNLFSLLNEFRGKVPEVTYELTIDGSDVLMHGLMNRKLHGAFVIRSPSAVEGNSELHSVKLSTGEYVLIVPERSPLSKMEEVSVKDLGHETIIMPSEKTLLHHQLNVMFQEEGISPRVLCSTSQSDVVGQLTAEGLGTAFASETIARKICPENCRIVRFSESVKIRRTIYFVMLRELLEYPLTKAFCEFVAGKYEK